jgi:hypothetical protein
MTRNRVAAPQERKIKKLKDRGGSEKQHPHYVKKQERQSTLDVTLVHVEVAIVFMANQQFLNTPR